LIYLNKIFSLTKTQNTKHKTQNTKHKTQNTNMDALALYADFCRIVPAPATLTVRSILMQVLTDLLDQEGGIEDIEHLQRVVGATQDALAVFVASGDETGVKCFKERLARYQEILHLAELIALIETNQPQAQAQAQATESRRVNMKHALDATTLFLGNNFHFI